MSARHVQILNTLLDKGPAPLLVLVQRIQHLYAVKNPRKALNRDLNHLVGLGAISVERVDEEFQYLLSANLEWPTQITETEFFKRIKMMPKGKVYGFLSS